MSEHRHSERVPGCYRCDLSASEERDHLTELVTRAERAENLYPGDVADIIGDLRYALEAFMKEKTND